MLPRRLQPAEREDVLVLEQQQRVGDGAGAPPDHQLALQRLRPGVRHAAEPSHEHHPARASRSRAQKRQEAACVFAQSYDLYQYLSVCKDEWRTLERSESQKQLAPKAPGQEEKCQTPWMEYPR